ncbi:MAG: hypothetical protein PSV16_09765 [Flavobacterium sp.]|nr:hypothetical protein [Flavobacterium sp.]
MKKYIAIICISFLSLVSCNKNETKSASPEKPQPETIAPKDTVGNKTPEEAEDPCVAGTPEPIIRRDHVANYKFKILTKQTLEETALLNNGDHVSIIIGGCEYYTLTFRFETSRFNDPTDDIAAWYANAHDLVTENLATWGNPNIEIKRGLMALSDYRNKNIENGQLKFNEEIDFDSDEIRNFVILEKIEKLENGKFAVTVVFSRGPL